MSLNLLSWNPNKQLGTLLLTCDSLQVLPDCGPSQVPQGKKYVLQPNVLVTGFLWIQSLDSDLWTPDSQAVPTCPTQVVLSLQNERRWGEVANFTFCLLVFGWFWECFLLPAVFCKNSKSKGISMEKFGVFFNWKRTIWGLSLGNKNSLWTMIKE